MGYRRDYRKPVDQPWCASRRALFIMAMIVIVLGLCLILAARAQAKNWDSDAEQTEQSIKDNKYLSKAGTLPLYKDGQPTGTVYHGNCCGEADAYEANEVAIDDQGQLWAVLTCDEPRHCQEAPEKCVLDEESNEQVCIKNAGKIVRQPGERFLVPPDKVLLGYDPTNDTGFGWVYIAPTSTGPGGTPLVYCWAAPPGY